MSQVETLIVGGGPAGAATAYGLAAAGHEALLIERSVGPHHKVCGEFLSVETQAQLQHLGVDAAALGAMPIDRIDVYSTRLAMSAMLPFRAQSLSRYRLDEALLRRAAEQGAQVRRGLSVRQVTRQERGWHVRYDDGGLISCRYLVLATGKWGLRGIEDARDASLVGLKMHLRLMPAAAQALAGCVELTLVGRTYAGIEQIEGGIANLCFLLPRAVVAGLKSGWPALHAHLAAASPHLAERLTGAEPLWDKPLAVVCPDGGHRHRQEAVDVYRVGDRLAHIPPFTGDGLAIALASAALAVAAIRSGQAPAAYLASARRLTGKPIRLASALASLARFRIGRDLLIGAARLPGLAAALVRHTRLPMAALQEPPAT
jgi:flavin-dependent dehydrogenase